MMNYQDSVVANTDLPVMMSSLMLMPLIAQQYMGDTTKKCLSSLFNAVSCRCAFALDSSLRTTDDCVGAALG